jgi:hypothetical protein
VFCGRHLLLARQWLANVAGSAGAVDEVARIVAQFRQKSLTNRSDAKLVTQLTSV